MTPVRRRSAVRLACVLGCLVVLCSCQTKPATKKTRLYLCPLSRAANETWVRHSGAMRARKEKLSTEIPKEYWTDGIRKLNPIKVYTHRFNIVVVQKLSDNVEEGKYIYIPISSYLPMDGDDGFTFKPTPLKNGVYKMGNGVLEYRRTKGN